MEFSLKEPEEIAERLGQVALRMAECATSMRQFGISLNIELQILCDKRQFYASRYYAVQMGMV